MTISVINATMRDRQEVQNAIRAVNRQLQEDFKRYWHADVQLRLEGWTGETPDPGRPLDMRGDAVIYLWDEGESAAALGYHALTDRGVPYGFVFLDLAKRLNEDWSVTLSHEALELAMDAEANRLVQGPHPDPAQDGRPVFHWYEICDAVQADTYAIGGVAVSNFLLPLYFTVDEEHRNHNDFLGLGVRSFGVRPGGYVGFYDPGKQATDTYHGPSDEKAIGRLTAKAELHNTTRTDRRGTGGDALNDPRWVTCDCITFELCPGSTADASSPLSAASDLVGTHLGTAWKVRPCRGGADEFDAIPTGSLPLTFADAWNHAHVLGDQPGVVYAEPSFTYPIPGETDAPDGAVRGLWLAEHHKPGTERHTWAIEQCRVPEAWRMVEERGHEPGAGVLIGHPDSGFVEHDEMDIDRVRTDIDWDFLDRDRETRTGGVSSGLHGLATASVIMSGSGNPEAGVSGPARSAELLPLRVTKPGLIRPVPVLLSAGMSRLRDAVYHAVDSGCKVISISLGGPRHRSLERAIRKAIEQGVIVCAAAGNVVRLVVAPASYPETIAVAGSDINRGPWSGSCRGRDVDVTAPAESVWRATVTEDGCKVVNRGYGTSCAVALTAGIAAVWLSYCSEELASRSPAEIPELFRHLLNKTASRRHGLPQKGFGAGIVDAAALLREPIPKSIRFPPRARHAVQPDNPDLRGIPEPLQRELTCAESLTALVDAARTAARPGPMAAKRPGDGARKLSDRLTRRLAYHTNRTHG